MLILLWSGMLVERKGQNLQRDEAVITTFAEGAGTHQNERRSDAGVWGVKVIATPKVNYITKEWPEIQVK
jgi:hypothetical protein